MATEEVYYPAYESWDKSISIDETVSDTLTLSWNADESSTVVKIIFETFAVDPETLSSIDSAFVRLHIVSGLALDPGLCISADYHHTRPITADDWTDASAGDAIDEYPFAALVAAAGGFIDIPLTDTSGIRQCPTGIRFVMLPEGDITFDNSVTIQGYTSQPAELHLRWIDDDGDGDDQDPDDNEPPTAVDVPDEDREPPDRPDGDDGREARHIRPREISEYAVYAAMLAAAKQRPTIIYQAGLKKGDSE